MSSVLKIKKPDGNTVYLSRGGLRATEIVISNQSNSSIFFINIPQYNVLVYSDKFGSTARSTDNMVSVTTYNNNERIDSDDVKSDDFSNYQILDQISKLEKYYLGMLQDQESNASDFPSSLSIKSLSDAPKYMLAANYEERNDVGNPYYDLYKCDKNTNWFSEIPGSQLSQEKARILGILNEKNNYSILADWDENFIDDCDIVYREPEIRSRIGPNQTFVPTEIAGTMDSPGQPLRESSDLKKEFSIQPKINGYAVHNGFLPPYYRSAPSGGFSVGINTFIESIDIEARGQFALYYRMINQLQDNSYYIKIYDKNTLVHREDIHSGGTLYFNYSKRPKFLRIEIFENNSRIVSRQETITYRYLGREYKEFKILDSATNDNFIEAEIELKVEEDKIWIPQVKSLDEIDIGDPRTEEQTKNGKLIYQLVISKIYDGKFFDEEIVFINRNQDGSIIEGTDGSQFNVVKDRSGFRKIRYGTNIPTGGSVVIIANLRIYPLSMYLYEKKDFFLEFIDIIERANVSIPRRKRLYFDDHPSNKINISPQFSNDSRKNIRFLHNTGTSRYSVVLYENHEENYAPIPPTERNRIKNLINVSVTKKNLYWEKNIDGSTIPQAMPYQIIDINVDDELKSQITSIELYSVFEERRRHIGNFIPTATIRAVDFSTSVLAYASQINNSELPFSTNNLPYEISSYPSNRIISQFESTKRFGIFYSIVINLDNRRPVEITTRLIEVSGSRLPQPVIYNKVSVEEMRLDLENEEEEQVIKT